MTDKGLTPQEIQMVMEINEAMQKLSIIDKAKVMGFVAGLSAQVADIVPTRKKTTVTV